MAFSYNDILKKQWNMMNYYSEYENMKIYLKKCMNLCFSAPPSDSSVKQMFKLSWYCTEIFDQSLSAWLSEGTLIYHWQN